MNILLLVFALPIAVITISIALQKILKCPPLVAGIAFSIFLVITVYINDLNLLIATIIYTIISYITAVLVELYYRRREINNCDLSSNVNLINSNCQNDGVTINETFDCINSNGIPTRINVVSNNGTHGCRGRR